MKMLVVVSVALLAAVASHPAFNDHNLEYPAEVFAGWEEQISEKFKTPEEEQSDILNKNTESEEEQISAGSEEFKAPEEEQDVEDMGEPLSERGGRMKRFACDLFSFQSKWLTPNHAMCAARCMAQVWKRNKGGVCVNGECICKPY